MLSRRLLSAAIGVPLLVLVVVIGGRFYDAVLALVLLLAAAEFLLQSGRPLRSAVPWLAGAAAAGLALAAPAGSSVPIGILITLFVLLVLVLTALRKQPAAVAWPLAAVVGLYAGWLGQYLGLLRQLQGGRSWVFFALFVTFASDSGAYFIGRGLGRHKLAPRISPSKTVEGAAGGLLFAALAAAALNLVVGPHWRAPLALALGLAVSAAGQAGDLLESALKRSLVVKDAGRLVPGHGGLLDRLDSLLFAGVVVYYVVQWVSR